MSESLISDNCATTYNRVLIQSEDTGAFLFLFKNAESAFPELDYWFGTFEDAKATAESEYKVAPQSWRNTYFRY